MVLSRSQEERVLAVLQRQLPESLPLGYCVAHLATAAKVKPDQHAHLARFLYAVVRKGQCSSCAANRSLSPNRHADRAVAGTAVGD